MSYLFTTPRLGFRKWSHEDLPAFAKLCADPEVMRYFLKPLTTDETHQLINRFIDQDEKYGYCYWAVEIKESRAFIGFIGLAYQSYESYFTPCVDIGWRLKRKAWGKGYATEGAKAALQYGFEKLGIKEVFSVTTHNNRPSENVMKKIGMERKKDFIHPRLPAEHALQPMMVYYISKDKK